MNAITTDSSRCNLFIMVITRNEASEDIIQKLIGVLGRWQIAICLIACGVKFPVAWQQLSIVFIAPPVTFTCLENGTDQCAQNCSEHVFDRHIFTETIITEWDLVCDKTYLTSFAQTVTMLGILFGNMAFGYLSDKFGRKNPLIGAVTLQIVSGIGVAFAHHFVLFLILRFFAAFATGGTMIITFVLVMEIVGAKWRTTFGILYQIPFSLGHLTLPLFAYFFRNWHHFSLSISLPSVVLLSYYFVLPESPRWLLSVGKRDEAVKTMEKAAHHNRLPTTNIKEEVESHNEEKETSANFLDLFRSSTLRTYTLCIGFNWFSCGLCFFGGAQYIGQLGGNIFINVALSAIIQIPGTLFSIWSLQAWGRKRTLMFSNLTSCISCILIGVVPKELLWLRSALSCVDMFGMAISFPTVYIYSGELFPTLVRNTGVGTGSMFARVGSMIAPFIAGLVVVEAWLPVAVFGIVPLIGALLCLKLPETVNCNLPDTIEEAEKLGQ